MSNPAPTGTPAPGAVTPNVKGSKQAVILIIIFLFVVSFLAMTIAWLNSENSSSDSNSSEKNSNSYSVSYDMSIIGYGKILEFDLAPNEKAQVELTNDWCPMWSSSQVVMFDSSNGKRVLLGSKFIKGPDTLKGTNMNVAFLNESKKTVTVKVGRCVSKNNCDINF
ncbi:TPA: hypothetical protein DCX66_03440 [Candidatus Nomurabacteria bacterium]|uniref:Uncharacterized protein n=1 Tax=Candidatus Nomurabacteria bacterium GW2011_GWE1_35_16 TaxID=1618761 RepID=A0A0G0BBV0_9BACT|nr:MAG: hypothetical protein UR55_C0001G0062 [Candidatus Nomurabacteria bacterium GW2011_GWF1_34_20]KKP63771.1 MAG: hypothetical protein UR57_C0001G0062 [Candidatus Nomurabacteria bacterium GW2011_GWE2_34_25]KKP66983.1 MAG: hypothetical protein UR64_C0001G0062 [Candidatus Nomurabacteria bacterium GW2011_GWE1_35_16]HAE36805.1 hypothetical protein [Candidatus Nomurabacteria bacterium]HAX65492.1 hypothetical protein [Candidatus Nomurabacteria bacterium]